MNSFSSILHLTSLDGKNMISDKLCRLILLFMVIEYYSNNLANYSYNFIAESLEIDCLWSVILLPFELINDLFNSSLKMKLVFLFEAVTLFLFFSVE